MPRKQRREKPKPIKPDWKYNSPIVTLFINKILKRGKKTVSENIFYSALDFVKDKTKQEPMDVLTKALNNIRPLLEVKPRRVGGATYQVPVEVRPKRGQTIAIRWLLGFAKQRKGKPMFERIATEILDAANNTGSVIKKKEDTHKMAEANKAFAHYRW